MINKNVIRLEFTKKGGLKYIAHLDLQRAMARIIKRSGIPIRYTEGFNPHPKMVFALPLSVGCESECELLDVYIVMDEKRPGEPLFTTEEFVNAITPILPEGLDLVSATYPEKSFKDIKSAVYEIKIDLSSEVSIKDRLSEILSSPMIVMKKSKSGDKEVDISPLIFSYSVKEEGKNLSLDLELSAAQNEYLNPEYVIDGIKANIDTPEIIDYYTILRKQIIFN